jgi:membrane-bound lytic murein transglycosylase MltF
MRSVLIRVSFVCIVAVLVACQSTSRDKSAARAPEEMKQATAPAPSNAGQAKPSLELPITFTKHLGDLEGMEKRRRIRALVVPSRSGFFYDKGRPQGINYEALEEFQRFVNQKLKTRNVRMSVVFIPVRVDQLEPALLQGVGDLVANAVIVTPEREKKALFTTPVATEVRQVVVTGPKSPAIESIEDLSGKEIYVNPLTANYESLQRLSAKIQQEGRAPILLKAADVNLTDEDLLEMTNAGLIPATVTIDVRAAFWAKVLPHLTVHPDAALEKEGRAAWVTRKDSPKLNALLSEFIQGRQVGTSFGNTLIRRYLQNTKWVKNSTTDEEMKKYQAYVTFFKKYAKEYDFDYLMLVAQGYQESLLDQSKKNPSGAVGIMQVIPKYAAAPPINIPNVSTAEKNIEAGAKMLHHIATTYFKDEKLDAMNRTLLTFASYNAGPTRIVRLQKKAAAEGLDPNKWFGNVELVVAKDIGQETVQYISNVYKYYVAYKLILQEAEIQVDKKQ